MSDEEPVEEEVPVEETDSGSRSASPPRPSVPPPTVPVIVGLVRHWSVFDLLRLLSALAYEVQARVVEEERAREDAALATRLGAPWRRPTGPSKGGGRGRGGSGGDGGAAGGSGSRFSPYR